MNNNTARSVFPPARVHRDDVAALAARVPPPAVAPYPRWVRVPVTEAEFIASLVVHSRDGQLPKRYPRIVPLCDKAGYVTGLPLKIRGAR